VKARLQAELDNGDVPDKIMRLPAEERLCRWASMKFSHAKKQAYNFPIQSLAASIAKRAMIRLASLGFKLVTQVHDSITVELRPERVERDVSEIKNVLENIYPLSVPLKADVKLSKSLDDKDVIDIAPQPKKFA
jgi:DNA polymerase I-like protein with 3'-5' exonuclease and polymerase domains